jgi:hypothetical protein
VSELKRGIASVSFGPPAGQQGAAGRGNHESTNDTNKGAGIRTIRGSSSFFLPSTFLLKEFSHRDHKELFAFSAFFRGNRVWLCDWRLARHDRQPEETPAGTAELQNRVVP